MRIAIYARVSTKDQSCALQLRDLKTYCAARKLTVFREYIDVGESGAKDSRPKLNELMADARKRKFDAILVWRFDRFARSTKHLLLALEEFRSRSPPQLCGLRPCGHPVPRFSVRRQVLLSHSGRFGRAILSCRLYGILSTQASMPATPCAQA